MRSAGPLRAAARRATLWLGSRPPSAILAAGLLVFVLYAFPGLMTMDSFDQLREGREWFFTDSHPPAMAALWGLVDRIVPGPVGMLVLQGTAFLAGIYAILQRAMRPSRAAWCAAAILVFPPVLTTLAVIWKDCLMAGFLVVGIALVLSPRRSVRIAGLGAFALATAMRYNALVATLPLVVLLFEWRPGQRWLARYAISVAAWLAVVAVALASNALLVDREMRYWYSSSALADIAGTLAQVEHDIPDEVLRPLLAPTEITAETNIHAAVRAKYKPYDFQQLISGDGQLWHVPWAEAMPEKRCTAVAHAWREILSSHVSAYLTYRIAMFGETLGLSRKYRGATVVLHRAQYPGMLDTMGVGRAYSRFQEVGERVTLWAARKTPLYRPYLYLLIALLLLPLARGHRDVLAILVSGIAMESSLFLLAWTPDFRFSHWLVTCTCLAVVMLTARRAKEAAA